MKTGDENCWLSETFDDLEYPRAMESASPPILRVWVKAWLMYFAVADSMLTAAVNLGLLPQFVFLPYLADGAGRVLGHLLKNAGSFGYPADPQPVFPGIWALLAQLVAYPLLIGMCAIKAQYLTNLVVDSLGTSGPLQDTIDTVSAALGIQSKEGKDKVEMALEARAGNRDFLPVILVVLN